MKKIASLILIISFIFISFNCGGGGSGSGVTKNLSQVRISAKFKETNLSQLQTKKILWGTHNNSMLIAANPLIQAIRYTVTGSSMEVITGTVPVENDAVDIDLMVPNGPQRQFVIEALDSSSRVTYAGSALRDLNGESAIIEIALEKVIGGTAPTGLNAVAVSLGQINLTWNAIAGNIQISGYKVYRNGVEVMTVTTTSASDTGLTQNTSYCYTVTAFDTSGESLHSNQDCATTTTEGPPPDVTGEWDTHFKCETQTEDVAVLTVTLNESTGGQFTGSGDGFNYDGTPLHMEMAGTYEGSTHRLSANVSTFFAGSECVRKDEFSTNLISNDTGYVTMTQTQSCGGCTGQVRMIKK